MGRVTHFEITCECGNSTTGSSGIHVDTMNGEIVCRACGIVSDKYAWRDRDIYEK